ncbi:MAG: hypothetical protein WC476_01550 [Phycisphaerae bacterium]
MKFIVNSYGFETIIKAGLPIKEEKLTPLKLNGEPYKRQQKYKIMEVPKADLEYVFKKIIKANRNYGFTIKSVTKFVEGNCIEIDIW